jgi:hypothetical protein
VTEIKTKEGQRKKEGKITTLMPEMTIAVFPGRIKIFPFSTSSRKVLGPTEPPFKWVLGAFSPEVKRPERDVDHSPPTSAEFKKTWISTSTPPFFCVA